MGGQVNVEVEASPQEDLSSVMASIRDHYETVANKNRRDVENWFQSKVNLLDGDIWWPKVELQVPPLVATRPLLLDPQPFTCSLRIQQQCVCHMTVIS